MKFKKIRILALFLVLFLSVSTMMVGCSAPEEQQEEENQPEENEPNEEEEANNENESEMDFPNKPLTIIVPYSAGGSSDTGARVISEIGEKYIGEKILVENRPGAGGIIGQTAGANAEPDGYTLLMMTTSVALHPLMSETDYELSSFIPIVQQVFDPDYLIIREGLPYTNWDELVEYAKNNPDEVKFGNSGAGTADSLISQYVTDIAELDVKHIPFDGDAKVLAALLGGHIDVFAGSLMAVQEQVETGEAIVVLNLVAERSENLPNVPTAKEKGMDVNSGSWRGLGVPSDTPEEIVEYLRENFGKAVQDPEHIEKMENLGLTAKYRSGEEFSEFINKQQAIYKTVLEDMEN